MVSVLGLIPVTATCKVSGAVKSMATSREIVNDLIYQVGALREFARRHDVSVQHVKPHGALYMELAANADLSQLFIQYMRTAAPNMFVFCMDRSATCLAAQEAGQPIVREFYADRDYGDTRLDRLYPDAGRPDPESNCAEGGQGLYRGGGSHRQRRGYPDYLRSPSVFIPTHWVRSRSYVIRREALVAEGIRIAPFRRY